MDIVDDLFAWLKGQEAGAFERLSTVTKEAVDTVAKDGSDTVGIIRSSVVTAVTAHRRSVREAAVASLVLECGLAVDPSNADDTERAEKASDYYLKTWSEALGKSEGEWAAAVELAREASAYALANIACYETFDAWNDEHTRAVEALNKDTEKVRSRWTTKHDGAVCPECAKLDKKYSDRSGLFALANGKKGRPPLHPNCRCFVVVGAVKAVEEEERSMNIFYPDQQGQLIHSAAQAKSQNDPISNLNDAMAKLAAAVEKNTLVNVETREAESFGATLTLKAIDATKRAVDFVASTDIIDSHDEVIDQGSWILEDFLKNPVVLFAHNSRELPIGRAVDVAVRNVDGRQQLHVRIEFAPEAMNPKAEQVWQMVQAKFLRAVSVGFVPKSYRYEMRNGQEVFVWADCVLKEVSVTPVPANPEALAKMKSATPRGHSKPAPASPGSTPLASPTAEEIDMDLKELQEKLTANAVAISDLQREAVTLKDSVTTAETRASKAEATGVELTAKLATLETEKSALEAQTKTLAADLAAAVERAEKSESSVIELEVEQLVGKKITPAEKPLFVSLRKSNPDLFGKMIEQRQPMKLDETITAKGHANGVGTAISGEDLSAKAISLVEDLGSKS